MNVFIENFILEHKATFKSYVRRDMAHLSMKFVDGASIEASGRTYASALAKLMEKLKDGDKQERKAARREKRKLIESFLSEHDALNAEFEEP